MRLSCYTIEKVFSGLKRERLRIHAPLNDPGQWRRRRRVLEINFDPLRGREVLNSATTVFHNQEREEPCSLLIFPCLLSGSLIIYYTWPEGVKGDPLYTAAARIRGSSWKNKKRRMSGGEGPLGATFNRDSPPPSAHFPNSRKARDCFFSSSFFSLLEKAEISVMVSALWSRFAGGILEGFKI